MNRTRETIKYKGFRIRVLGWGNTYSAWVMAPVGRELVRLQIISGDFSKTQAIRHGMQAVNLIIAKPELQVAA